MNRNLQMRTIIKTLITGLFICFIVIKVSSVRAADEIDGHNNILAPAAPSTPDLDPSDDTGTSNTDNITKNTTGLTLSGTSDASVTIKIFNGATQIATTTSSAGGAWSVDISLAAGSHSITAIANDGADSPASGALAITVDTTPPGTPTLPDLAGADDSGGSNSDNITNQTTNLSISGTADANSPIELFNGVSSLGTTTANGGGNWSFDLALSAGSYTITAVATDVAGNTATSGVLNLVIDTSASAPSAPDLDSSDDSGTSNSDNLTNVTTNLTFTGTAEANSSVELFEGANSLGTTTASGGGAWTINVNLAAGAYVITAVTTDVAGNTSSASTALNLTVDTSAPAVPSAPDLDPTDDSGTSNSDNYTNVTTGLTFTGTSDANTPIELYNGATLLGSTTSNGAGAWSININLAAGSYTITAKSNDAAGNSSAASAGLSLTIDTANPNAPSTPDLNAADDAGQSSTDNITKNTTGLTFSGTADANTAIELFNGATSLGTTTSSGGGAWSIDATLAAGTHSITARATDQAGNTATSSGLSVTIDTTPPTVSGAFDPVDGTTSAPTNTTFTINFNENIYESNTGSISGSQDKFQVIRTSGNSLTIDVIRSSVDVAITGSQAIVTNSGSDLALNTSYYVNIGNKVFMDLAGNDYVGLGTIAGLAADNSTWNFTTSAGLTITAPTLSTCALDYSVLGNIVLAEGAGNDINSSASTTYSLILTFSNPDYRFKSGVGNLAFTANGDITARTVNVTPTSATFNIDFEGGNAKNEIDQITISGLEVSSGGSASSSNIVVSVSSTILIPSVTKGTTALATISPAAAGTPPTFTVEALPGNASVDPNQTRFSVSSPSIKLVGSPAGGVFSGNGVVFNISQGFYSFVPSAVGASTNTITYTYTPGGGCPVTTNKDFTVFVSNINNLDQFYCSNGAQTTMSVDASYITNRYGVGATFVEFVYWTDVPAGSNLNYQAVRNPDTPGNSIFNPATAAYQSYITLYGSVWIGFRVSTGAIEWVNVPIRQAPNVALSLPPSFCENNGIVNLASYATPTPISNSKFLLNGVDLGTTTLNPASVTPKNTVKTVTYEYTDPTTGCKNSIDNSLTIFTKPGLASSSVFHLYFKDISATLESSAPTTYACEDESFDYIVSVPDQNPVWPNDYRFNFYNQPSLVNTSLMYQQSWFFYPYTVNTATPGSTDFYVTQTVNGCESDALTIKAKVNQRPTVSLGNSNPVICATDNLVLSSLTPQIGGSGIANQSYWVSFGDGQFLDATTPGNPVSAPATDANGNAITTPAGYFVPAIKYKPGPNDLINQFVQIALFTNDPDGANQPCYQVAAYAFVTINPSPTAFAGNDAAYCADDKIFLSGSVNGANANTTTTWTVNPIGGAISSNTSLSTEYVASLAQKNNSATLTFTLSTNDPDGAGPCLASTDDVVIQINQEATIDAGVDLQYCSYETINLTATKPVGSGATSYQWTGGTGTINNGNTLTPTYTFALAEVGTTIPFTITAADPDGTGPCKQRSDQVLVRIKTTPAPPIIASEFKYCVTPGIPGATAALSASGPDVKWYNNPALTGTPSADPYSTGITTLNDSKTTFYATSTIEGCESTTATASTITVNPAPYPSFSVANFCLGDFTQFTDTTPALVYTNGNSGSVVSWSYQFGNGIGTPSGSGSLPASTNSTTGTYDDPAHKYSSVGLYNPTLTVTTSDGCTNTADAVTLTGSQIRIGYVPVADFKFEDICEDDVTSFTYLINKNPASGDMKTFDWDFGDPASGGSNTSALPNPNHTFADFNTYSVTLTLTSNLDCIDQITKQVHILPYIKSYNPNYTQDFETTTHGWFSEGLARDFKTDTIPNSWYLTDLGTAGRSITANLTGGSKAFLTVHPDSVTYYENERSVLNGPCFDVTALPRPALSFAYWNNTSQRGDGVYVETSINGGDSWQRLGDNASGLRWYNEESISGLTTQLLADGGGIIGQTLNQYGFSGSTNGWIVGKYSFDSFASNSKVRVRFVFGSNGDSGPFDGFALDNFKLDSRNRTVLVENFTDVTETTNNNDFNNFKSSITNDELVKVQYHSSLKMQDPINLMNPEDPNARIAFYGISNTPLNSIPRAYIDGYSSGNISSIWADRAYSVRSLEDAYFSINLTSGAAQDGIIEVSPTIIVNQDLPFGAKPILRLAIVEKTKDANQYVLRKFLPNAAGYPLFNVNLPNLPITAGNPLPNPPPASFIWEVDNADVDQTDLAVVVFIQDQNNNIEGFKQVYQSAILLNPLINPVVVTKIEDPEYASKINLYPNPANQELQIVLPAPVAKPTLVNMVDGYGKVVHQLMFNTGEQQRGIRTSELSQGVYIVQIGTPEGGVAYRKIVITH